MLAWVRRQFFNERPQFTFIDRDPQTNGTMLVDVDASDREDDAIVYTATNGANGTVSVNPDVSSLTYTPNEGFSGTDTFQVTASDVGRHVRPVWPSIPTAPAST